MITRAVALEAANKHFSARFPDGRFGSDFQETLVDFLASLGGIEGQPVTGEEAAKAAITAAAVTAPAPEQPAQPTAG